MIVESKYVYITTVLLWLVFSLFFLLFYKKKRNDMLLLGIIIALHSIITAHFFWTKDWWFPETLFGGAVGIEDFILGFNTGVLAVGINELFFPEKRKKIPNKDNFLVVSTCLIFLFCMFSCFYIFNINSFFASIISITISTLWIYIRSKISPLHGLLFGLIYTISYIPIYFFILYINSEWISATWDLSLLSGIVFFGFIPMEELVFWFIFGVIFKQIYTAWLNGKPAKNPAKF